MRPASAVLSRRGPWITGRRGGEDSHGERLAEDRAEEGNEAAWAAGGGLAGVGHGARGVAGVAAALFTQGRGVKSRGNRDRGSTKEEFRNGPGASAAEGASGRWQRPPGGWQPGGRGFLASSLLLEAPQV